MDFRTQAIESQKKKAEEEPDWIDIHIDPPDPETGEDAPPVRALPPTAEQIAIYTAAFGGQTGVKVPQFMNATLNLLQDTLLDDGFERIVAKFRDRSMPDWDIQRLRQIVRELIQAATGRPTEPSSESSSTSAESGGRSSTVTSAPRGSTRSRSPRAGSGT